MKPDPNTKEGREQIRKILQRRQARDRDASERAKDAPEEEPVGKFTTPSEMDLRRDRKSDDD